MQPDFPDWIESPCAGWIVDRIQRYKQGGQTHYTVQLIRRVDGACVYGMNGTLAAAFHEARQLAGAFPND